MIMDYAKQVYPKRRLTNVLKDKDDHKILECAIEAGAALIITADRGLLKLKEFEGIRIAHPSMLKYWFK
jgi:predicted nucleic acid-binding protein